MGTRYEQDWITGFLRYTENSEPPTLFKTWVAISVVASALQRKCVLNWGPLTFYPNFYVVLVAPAGRCRKGTAMGPGYKMLKKLGIKLAAEAITREALIKELAGSSVMAGDPKTGNVQTHSSLTIFSPELTVFLGYDNKTLMADLTDWFDCANEWTYRTKNSGSDEIIGVWVNLLGATTPELINSALPPDAIGGGLTSRMIFVYEDKKSKIVPAPFLTPAESQLGEKLQSDLEQINMMQGEFKVTDDFIDLWTDWYCSQENNPPFKSNRFNAYFERRPVHILKLSMIMNASRIDGNMIITAQDLKKAITTLQEVEVKMPRTFNAYGRNTLAEVVNKTLQMVGIKKEVSFAELLQTFVNDATRDEMNQVIETLVAMKYCRRVVKGGEVFIHHVDNKANPHNEVKD